MRHFYKITYLLIALIPFALIYNNMGKGWTIYESIIVFFLFCSIIILLSLIPILLQAPNVSWCWIDITVLIAYIYFLCQSFINNQLSLSNERALYSLYIPLLYFLFKAAFSLTLGKKIFIVVTFVCGALTALHGLAQLLHIFPSGDKNFLVTGTFGNPGLYAGYLACTLPICLGVAFYCKKNNRRLFYVITIAVIVLITFILIIAQSRSAWLAVIISCAFIMNNHFRLMRKVQAWLLLMLLFVLLAIVLVPLKSDSASGRKFIWKVSFEMWKKAPLTGLGSGQFVTTYNNYQAVYFEHHPNDHVNSFLADNTYYAFNEFIEIAVEYGTIGLVLFLVLLVQIFITDNSNTTLAKATILNICTFGVFSYPFSSLAISIVFVACLALVASHSKHVWTFKRNYILQLMTVGLMFLVSLTTYKIYVRYGAVKQWHEAYTLLTNEQETEAFEKYKQAYPLLQNNGGFLFNYGTELSEAGRYEESILVLKKAQSLFNHIDLYIFLGNSYKGLKQYSNAEAAYNHAAFMIPNRLYPKYLLVQLYKEQHQINKALTLAKEILSTKTKINSPTTTNIKSEMEMLLQENDTTLIKL